MRVAVQVLVVDNADGLIADEISGISDASHGRGNVKSGGEQDGVSMKLT